MGRFYVKKEKRNLIMFLPLLVLLVFIVSFIIATNHLSKNSENQEYTILERALTRSITQCYALEGMYPPNLQYLEDHYGLTYNEEHFYIDYQYIGSNLRPDVTIIERD